MWTVSLTGCEAAFSKLPHTLWNNLDFSVLTLKGPRRPLLYGMLVNKNYIKSHRSNCTPPFWDWINNGNALLDCSLYRSTLFSVVETFILLLRSTIDLSQRCDMGWKKSIPISKPPDTSSYRTALPAAPAWRMSFEFLLSTDAPHDKTTRVNLSTSNELIRLHMACCAFFQKFFTSQFLCLSSITWFTYNSIIFTMP